MKNNPPESWHSSKIKLTGYKNPWRWTNIRMKNLRKAFYEAKAKADAAAAAELLKIISENDNVDYSAAEAKAAAYDVYINENYTINIKNSGLGTYLINKNNNVDVNNGTIELVRGNTYNLVVNANGHPFWIQTVSGGYNSSNVYNSGITNNGTQNGIITFTVQDDAPNTLYYACEFHSSMQGLITITGDIDDDDEFLGIGENENSDGIPDSGLNLIKKFEGCRLKAYNDPLSGGKPITVGWGSTKKMDGSDFVLDEKIEQSVADDLLLNQCKKNYLPSISKIPHWNEMNDGQKGALLSFAYNLGPGFYGSSKFTSITAVLKNKEWAKVPDTLYIYRNKGTNVEAGLAKRRTAEGVSWTKGTYP